MICCVCQDISFDFNITWKICNSKTSDEFTRKLKMKIITCAAPCTLLMSSVSGGSRPRDRKACAISVAPCGPSARVSVDEMSNLTKMRSAYDHVQLVQTLLATKLNTH